MNQRRTHECLKRRRIEIIDLTSSKNVIETINLCNEDSEEESSLVSVPGRSLSSTSSICHNSVRLHSKAHIPIHQSSDDRLDPLESLNAMLQFNGSDEAFCREFDVLPKHLEYYKIIRDCMSKLGLTHIDLKGSPFQCCVCLDVVCKATSFACEGKHTCCKTCHDNMFKLCFEEAKVMNIIYLDLFITVYMIRWLIIFTI